MYTVRETQEYNGVDTAVLRGYGDDKRKLRLAIKRNVRISPNRVVVFAVVTCFKILIEFSKMVKQVCFMH